MGQLIYFPQPVIEYRFCRVAPGIVNMFQNQAFREFFQPLPVLPGCPDLLLIIDKYLPDVSIKIILGERWVVVYFGAIKAQDFTLVFFQQADVIIYRMTLKKHNAKTIRADGKMHTGFFADRQDFESVLFHIALEYFIKPGMRDIKTGVDFCDQWMGAVG